jgi:hypothetical protein
LHQVSTCMFFSISSHPNPIRAGFKQLCLVWAPARSRRYTCHVTFISVLAPTAQLPVTYNVACLMQCVWVLVVEQLARPACFDQGPLLQAI